MISQMFFDSILLLIKLISWCIKWHDVHGHVFIFLDYGHILIDASFHLFSFPWMYIMQGICLCLFFFLILWPLFDAACSYFFCNSYFMHYGLFIKKRKKWPKKKRNMVCRKWDCSLQKNFSCRWWNWKSLKVTDFMGNMTYKL